MSWTLPYLNCCWWQMHFWKSNVIGLQFPATPENFACANSTASVVGPTRPIRARECFVGSAGLVMKARPGRGVKASSCTLNCCVSRRIHWQETWHRLAVIFRNVYCVNYSAFIAVSKITLLRFVKLSIALASRWLTRRQIWLAVRAVINGEGAIEPPATRGNGHLTPHPFIK